MSADERPLCDLAAHILITALSQTMPIHFARPGQFISDSCKAYCYQLIHEWRRGDGSSDLLKSAAGLNMNCAYLTALTRPI